MPAPSPITNPSRPLVERPAGARRLVVARRQRAHDGEAADAERRHRRLGAAGDHRVLLAVADQAERLADRLAARGAGAGRRVVHPGAAEADRDVPGRHVGDQARDEERRHALPARPRGRRAERSSIVAMPPMPTPTTTPMRGARLGRRPRSRASSTAICAAAIANCAKRSIFLMSLLLEVVGRIEVAHLAGDAHREARRRRRP